MCGIFGALATRDVFRVADGIRATTALQHRGPDGAGFAVGRAGQGALERFDDAPERIAAAAESGETCSTFLGHRRLAILDLDAAADQPMTNEDGRVWVVFNGELYNHRELRQELTSLGHRFVTDHSDTECLVHGFEQWGVDVLERLCGMFAFAALDLETSQLLLARDRFGKKPLYFELRPGSSLIFASELKAFRDGGLLHHPLDAEALGQYLRYGYVPAPRTIFEGVQKLRAAEYALFDVRELARGASGRYWSLPDVEDTGDEDAGAWQERFEAQLRDAVGTRLVADVPVGVFLSGGLDSSTVSRYAASEHRGIEAFTIRFGDDAYDEGPQAAAAAEAFGLSPRQRTIGEGDLLELVPALAEVYDEPFSDASALPTLSLARLARESVTVALSGDGGDELLGGYTRYRLHEALGRWLDPWPPALVQLLAAPFRRLWPENARGAGTIPLLVSSSRARYRQLLGDPFLLDRSTLEPQEDPVEQLWQERSDPLRSMIAVDTELYLPEDLMVKVDRASMSCSLEVRSPMLDHRLFELVFRSATRLWRTAGENKAPLAKILERDLKRSHLERRKRGFAVPLGRWLREGLAEPARELLCAPDAFVREVVPRDAIERLLHRHRSGSRDLSPWIWRLWMFESWHRAYGGALR